MSKRDPICKCGDTKGSHTSGKYYCQRGFLNGRPINKVEQCKCMAYVKATNSKGKKA